ncbi:glycosyltransferase family 2 protein [Pseudanabaena sp. FACHB-2040]|uniref:glycosyltransferase family 2 protein n=1 Tax=Pseudanabaena sp. FACHB-2040 TaxID=2692859 RepID=UPI00168938ED|nr:glycosyltransferase family 2 protein [Pseudanabaena sp. FACHB-2040]MBD2260592.1 glycosyltransferase family 2 protein [Pseudanabaena sp. FACHB-2040]
MKQESLAVLLTCFNRREKTLSCLRAIYNQELTEAVSLLVYLVDDGSTDGTAVAVKEAFPEVNIIYGSGNLFWNGGMRLAFAEASKQAYDFYLWLNDDTHLYPDAICRLLDTAHLLYERGKSRSIVIGSTQDPKTGALTYGGIRQRCWWRPLQFSLEVPSDQVKACDTMNGNCVLLSKAVIEVVGNLDPAFDHDLGDYDYGLRAKRQQCSIWITPGYIGTCPPNPHSSRMDKSLSSIDQRLSKVNHPKGLALDNVTLHPFTEWKVFSQRHGGLLWPIFWLLPYRRLLTSLFAFKGSN